MPAALDTPEERADWTSFHEGVVKSICWRYGVPMDHPETLIEANEGNTFDPAKVAVPALIIVGEGERGGARARRRTFQRPAPNASHHTVVKVKLRKHLRKMKLGNYCPSRFRKPRSRSAAARMSA